MAAMLHDRNNSILFQWDKMFILMQNIFIVPAMQHGRHAKPLLSKQVSKQARKKGTGRVATTIIQFGMRHHGSVLIESY